MACIGSKEYLIERLPALGQLCGLLNISIGSVETSRGTYEAANVVLATGGFPRPKLPQASAAIPVNIMQLHSSQYRKPQRLPSGAVLVVGSGQSGSQIAEELHQSGRQVYISHFQGAQAGERK